MSRLKSGSVTMAEIRAVYPALGALADVSADRPTIDPETAEWLDGPSFVRWVKARGIPSAKSLGPSLERRVREWQQGSAASLYCADKIVTMMGYHLSDLPEEMWVPAPKRKAAKIVPEDVKREALKRLEAGDTVTAVARALDVTTHTIRNWRRAA